MDAAQPHAGPPGAANPPRVVVRGLDKSFGGAAALTDVSLSILPGEIHGLLGENGSGKSTLIKVLSGFHAPDAGDLEVDGSGVPLPLGPGQFQELGFAFVHQDLGLLPALTVLENLRLDDFVTMRAPYLSWRTMTREARAVLASYAVDLDPQARVADLSAVQRSLLAIIRALESIRARTKVRGGGLLVLDEPTVYLPQQEVSQLFRLLRDVTATGTAALFVSHDLDEVLEICDRVTVLRDGRVVASRPVPELDKPTLVQLIVGRQLAAASPVKPEFERARPPVAYRVTGLSGGAVADVSFDVDRGEVLGITGLAGSGFQEVPYLLYGARRAVRGTLSSTTTKLPLARLDTGRAVREGIILVPGNRQVDGCIQSLTVTENVTIPRLGAYFRRGVLRHRREDRDANSLMQEFTVKPADPRLRVGDLSGGNQQKVLLGKWLQIHPTLLLFDEPTQGVDVGARHEIFRILRQSAAEGASIVCASSDHEQLAAICDRVLVFARGTVVAELAGTDLTKERISEQCLTSIAS